MSKADAIVSVESDLSTAKGLICALRVDFGVELFEAFAAVIAEERVLIDESGDGRAVAAHVCTQQLTHQPIVLGNGTQQHFALGLRLQQRKSNPTDQRFGHDQRAARAGVPGQWSHPLR